MTTTIKRQHPYHFAPQIVVSKYTIHPDGVSAYLISKGLTTTEANAMMMMIDLPPTEVGPYTRWISSRELSYRLGRSERHGLKILRGLQTKGFIKKTGSTDRGSNIYDISGVVAVLRQMPAVSRRSTAEPPESADLDEAIADAEEIYGAPVPSLVAARATKPKVEISQKPQTDRETELERRAWRKLVYMALDLYPHPQDLMPRQISEIIDACRAIPLTRQDAVHVVKGSILRACQKLEMEEASKWTGCRPFLNFVYSRDWAKIDCRPAASRPFYDAKMQELNSLIQELDRPVETDEGQEI